MQLREWQQQLQQAIVSCANAELSLRPGAITAERQLAIYQNAYTLRLTEALRANYTALHQLLGDNDFDTMAQRYIAQRPSVNASIRWFGDRLADFLLHEEPYAQCPAMADLAHFEWALRHTIDAGDACRVTFEAMQIVAPDRWGELTFNLHPSLTLLRLDWNAPEIWRALTHELNPPPPVAESMGWLIYRDADLITQWRSISDDESAALSIVREGGNFDAVCELAAQRMGADAAATAAAGWLKLWISEGLLTASTVVPRQTGEHQ